jgi:CubicO group peptidase (beta-lactamase class C family)
VLTVDELDRLAGDTGFSGVVRVDRAGQPPLARAYGWAHRGAGTATTTGTRIPMASGVKGFTALTVVSLVEEGRLALDTPAREVLGADLPLVDPAVTVEHLLTHRSGIGDYLDEDSGQAVTDHVLPVPVHRLDRTEAYLEVLDGHPQQFPPGERFAYNNGGYVVLALIAERVGGRPFPELVDDRVCRPAGMVDTAFLRSDEPAGGVALGYLGDGLRTNLLHLPVLGSGDGGAVTTAADLVAFWTALFQGRIVPPARVAELVRPHSVSPDGRSGYGLGFWLVPGSPVVLLEGYDAGVSFRTVCDPDRQLIWSVLSNTTDGAWPVARRLSEVLGG